MDETQQNDSEDWRQGRPLRVRGYMYRTTKDDGAIDVHSYQVVYAQEPLWVLHLRFTEPNGDHPTELRVFLRPQDDSEWWSGVVRYSSAGGE